MAPAQDILLENWNEIKGQVGQKWGKLTDNDLVRLSGKNRRIRRHPTIALWLWQGSGRTRN